MGTGAVDGHGGSDTDSADHISDLTDDMIRQNSPGIIFNHSISNTVKSHNGAQNHQDFKSRESPGQHIDGSLGCKGAHKYSTGYRRLGICVRQPGMNRRHRGI